MSLFCLFLAISFLIIGNQCDDSDESDEVSLRIVEGTYAKNGLHPFMVSIVAHGEFQCGGTIINTNWILSAAHCFFEQESENLLLPDFIYITLGDINWKAGKKHRIFRYFIHERYDDENFNNDIAVAQVRVPIVFDKFIKPIKLMRTPLRDDERNYTATVSGWGFYVNKGWNESSDTESNSLLTVQVSTLPIRICRSDFDEEILPPTKICVSTANRKGSCQGDSGGPLIWHGVQIDTETTKEVEPTLRIVEGPIASGSRYLPYMTSIQVNGTHVCGGSLISDVWILTAAHCFFDTDDQLVNPHHIRISVGNTAWKRGILFKVSTVIIHDEYDNETFINDIALVGLKKPMVLNAEIKPIILDDKDAYDYHNRIAVVSGWGNFVEDGVLSEDISDDLRTVQVKIIAKSACEDAFEEKIPNTKICVQASNKTGTCIGDSGGPLVIDGTQVGIVSSGYDCPSEIPDMYTRVSSFHGWIFRHMHEYKPDDDSEDYYQKIYANLKL